MKIKDYQKKIQGKGKINASLYQLNQGIMKQLPNYTEEQIKELEEKITKWEWKYTDNSYFMLLCNDIHYYTIFHLDPEFSDFRNLGEGVVYLLKEAGYEIPSDEECDDHYEIWAKKDDDCYVFMLFPYDQGVVNFG